MSRRHEHISFGGVGSAGKSKGTFLRYQVHKRVGISLVEVYERV